MTEPRTDLLAEVATYYSGKLAEHGECARGVDWNGEVSQFNRFKQLCRVLDEDEGPFSINDLGCGYGALTDYLIERRIPFSYRGYDVSEDMVRAARERRSAANVFFVQAPTPDQEADYGVASGIFNVRLNSNEDAWRDYMLATVDALHRTSRKGFAFNCLTSYSDQDKMRDYLHYANPLDWFDLCKRKYSRQVALLHDYGLYEFTIIVRREAV